MRSRAEHERDRLADDGNGEERVEGSDAEVERILRVLADRREQDPRRWYERAGGETEPHLVCRANPTPPASPKEATNTRYAVCVYQVP